MYANTAMGALAALMLLHGCGDDAPGDIDAGPGDTDAGADVTDAGPGPSADLCADLAAALPARAGATIQVAPAGGGMVLVDGAMQTLRQVVASASSGDTISLDDGIYDFQEAGPGNYTGLYITTPDITIRSTSGVASAVILDSSYADHGDQTAPVTVAASGVVLADFTVRASIFHLVHLWDAADGAVLHNLRLLDGGQQFVKGSPGGGTLDNVQVSCSHFAMTQDGRDNVWGYGAQDGGTTCYTGGIDAHDSRDWQVLYNRFEGIYCDADGVDRPAHGKKAEVRGGMTYTGGLAEHAIHMWDSAQGSAHTLAGNVILDCARGIGVGLQAEVYGTSIYNNMIWSQHAGTREHDVGIIVERGHDISIEHNTVYYSHPDAYPNAIEYRWDSSTGLVIRNNLTNGLIRERNGAQATLSQNVSDAQASWFTDAEGGDLHLASCELPQVVGAGDMSAPVSADIDGDARDSGNDIGADQCTP